MPKFLRHKRLVVRLLLVAAAEMIAGGVVLAGERIVFKSGHTIVAKAKRVEGDFLYLLLDDGSEIGFPLSLVAETKTGVKSTRRYTTRGWGGRGPSGNQTTAFQRSAAGRRRGLSLSGRLGPSSKGLGGMNMVGFSMGGFARKNQRPGGGPPMVDLMDPSVRDGSAGLNPPLSNGVRPARGSSAAHKYSKGQKPQAPPIAPKLRPRSEKNK